MQIFIMNWDVRILRLVATKKLNARTRLPIHSRSKRSRRLTNRGTEVIRLVDRKHPAPHDTGSAAYSSPTKNLTCLCSVQRYNRVIRYHFQTRTVSGEEVHRGIDEWRRRAFRL